MFKTGGVVRGRLERSGTRKGYAVPAIAEISTIIFDSADPSPLADFYRRATGWETTYRDDDFVTLGNGGAIQLAFQRVEGYRSAGWPDPAKHAHLDLRVADLAAAEKELIGLGAGRPEFQPGGDGWVVLTDPEGHVFCITTG
ncbi:MAG TPA: VOC family protein [Micromonosporaceae bacterium]|nr:VOC family protein [Micromonosporaceae bacterium]